MNADGGTPRTEPAPPPGVPPAPDARNSQNNRGLLVAIIVLLVLLVVVLGAFLFYVANDSDEQTSITTEAPEEIFLEPIAEVGPDPFTESVATAGLPAVTPESTTGTEEGVATVSGATEGLYGGTLDQASCDRERMVEFLLSNPEKAAAWAEVQGISVDGIEAFTAELTPVQLTRDTRVTNHGYRNGRPTARQSVLQAGTAVLVDRYGVPRVRCACGNPLLEPVRAAAAYRGASWAGWNPNRTVTVTVSVEVTEFVLVNVATGGQIVRPAGTSGGSDTDPGTTTTTTTTTTAAPPRPTQAPTTAGSSGVCPPGYTEIGGHCVDEYGNEPGGAGGSGAEPSGPCPPGYDEIGGHCVDEYGNEPSGAG